MNISICMPEVCSFQVNAPYLPARKNIWTFEPPVKTGGYLKLYPFGINFLNSMTLGLR